VRDTVASIGHRQAHRAAASGESIRSDKLVLSPGVREIGERVDGMKDADASGRHPQGLESRARTSRAAASTRGHDRPAECRDQDSRVAYRCTPGSTKRACIVGHYFKAAKPRSKVLILAANET